MNIDIRRYDDLVQSVYASALEPTGWTDTIGAIADTFDARRCWR